MYTGIKITFRKRFALMSSGGESIRAPLYLEPNGVRTSTVPFHLNVETEPTSGTVWATQQGPSKQAQNVGYIHTIPPLVVGSNPLAAFQLNPVSKPN